MLYRPHERDLIPMKNKLKQDTNNTKHTSLVKTLVCFSGSFSVLSSGKGSSETMSSCSDFWSGSTKWSRVCLEFEFSFPMRSTTSDDMTEVSLSDFVHELEALVQTE